MLTIWLGEWIFRMSDDRSDTSGESYWLCIHRHGYVLWAQLDDIIDWENSAGYKEDVIPNAHQPPSPFHEFGVWKYE